MALALGQGIELVHIRPTPACRGLTMLAPPHVGEPQRSVISGAGEAAVGLVEAEGYEAPTRDPGPWLDAWLKQRAAPAERASAAAGAQLSQQLQLHDRDKLGRSSRSRHPVDVKAHGAMARIQARRILREVWPGVLQVADALLEHGCIDGKNINIKRGPA